MTTTSTVSTTTPAAVQAMFNHLAATYTADEAAALVSEKYPGVPFDASAVPATAYKVTKVEMGKTVSEKPAGDLLADVKAKTAKAPKAAKVAKEAKAAVAKAEKGPSKVELAREIYNEAPDKSRAVIVELFINALGFSKAMASTYYYTVKA